MPKSLGQICYEGYFEYSKGKSLISGQSLPTWENQSTDIQSAWEHASRCVEIQIESEK